MIDCTLATRRIGKQNFLCLQFASSAHNMASAVMATFSVFFLYKFNIDMNDIVVLFYFYSRRNKSKRHVSCLFINITIDTVSWQRELREGVFYFTVDFLRYLA